MKELLLAVGLFTLAYNATYGEEIINGWKAKKNTMQYMASVQVDGKHKCGGFLIDSSYVLTAAHCELRDNTTVVLGSHDISGNNLHRYTVEKQIKHSSYNQSPVNGGDIMLLKLSKKVKQSKVVKIIKLAKAKHVKPNTSCLVAGWGRTEEQSKVNYLLETSVSTINLKTCQKEWSARNVKIPTNVLCAGGYKTKSGACKGDSGGPLVCGNEAVGIVSFNYNSNCNYPNLPNIYTQISTYRSWIEKIIKKGA